ncbi:hypothetical protein [Nocardia panacis]|uniref:hypothetical protein n=1 Tax=Nocardia panacis TaxID=2340916 RepID=UPI001EF0512B|nr:hypothetical protein [Nocardia panacis]
MAAATQILDYVGGTLIIPQTVLVNQYWQEIRTGLADAGIPICHFVLHADRDELIQRIQNDRVMGPSQWRFDHLDDYDAARSWHSRQAHVIDTTGLQPRQVAELIAADTARATTK